MKSGETIQVGKATITKLVTRASVAQRDAAGTKLGRRSFSETTYIVKIEGRYVAMVSTLKAASDVAGAQ